MRFAALAFVLLILISPFIGFSSAQDDGSNEHFPALMFLVIEPVGPAVAEVEPLGHYSFKFKFYNGGYFQSNLYAFWTEFRVKVEGEGWTAYVEPTHTYFYPSETKFGVVNVEAGARPSNFAYIHVYGRFRDIYGFWHHGNYTFQVKTTQYHSFDARIEEPFIKAKQDDIYSVPITVRNFGNYEDRFYLEPEYLPPGWKITFSDPVLIIPPGGEATTYIYFATPHESIYLQYSSYLIRIRVGAEGASPKLVAMIVSMEGFHFTPAQVVAIATTMPSILILAILLAFSRHYSNPCNFIPKPWKEEAEELKKLNEKERKKRLKEMKEEWLSARYYCKEEYKKEKELEKLRKLKEKKERKLKEKLEKAWEKSWKELEEKWKEEKRLIDEEYQKWKQRIEKKWKEASKLISIDKPVLTKPDYPPKPKKLSLPSMPKYFIDENRLILIEPDEISIKRAMMDIKNNKRVAEGEKLRIERMGKEIRNRIKMEAMAIEKRIDSMVGKAKLEMQRKADKVKLLKKLK
jgi:hypothetical protein